MDYRTAAELGIGALEHELAKEPPAGISLADLTRFFGRFRKPLTDELARMIEAQIGAPISQRLDRDYRGKWHLFTERSIREELSLRAGDEEQRGWLLSRIPIHRPDLMPTASSWATLNHLAVPFVLSVPQPIPAEESGRLVIYELPAVQARQLAGILNRDQFEQFASLAYHDSETSGAVLLDIAAGWLQTAKLSDGKWIHKIPIAAEEFDAERLAELASIRQRGSEEAKADLMARLQLLKAAGIGIPKAAGHSRGGTAPAITVVDLAHAPSAQDLLDALNAFEDDWTVGERTSANLLAISRMTSPLLDQRQNWRDLLRYSGWGGLSIDAVRDQIPDSWTPDANALIHEYYTPTRVALEIARVIRPWITSLPRATDGFVMALEPSAGIGRLLNAASTPGFEQLQWSVVEYSRISASILQAIRPDLTIAKSSFEEWVSLFENTVRSKLGLVLSNPPYGIRGATFTIDRNKEYREQKAYVYFLRRCLDLLAIGGVGVFIVPYGFMTGTSGSFFALREAILKRNHLRAAFRLPSRLFPGAAIVTDVLFFEGRGGELSAVQPEDQYIVDGKYFDRNPSHLLGIEKGASTDEDDLTAKPRYGYEVIGEFTEFPPFEPRLRCESCEIKTIEPTSRLARTSRRKLEDLAPYIRAAVLLGERVRRYLELIASHEHAKLGRAAALQPELLEALVAWARNLGRQRNPWTDNALTSESKATPELLAFLSAFTEEGALIPQIAVQPSWEPVYQGKADDVIQQAEWLYSVKRELTVSKLDAFRKSQGIFSIEPLHTQLISAGWCFDNGTWLPERDYYSGNLWDRWDRARDLAKTGDVQAAAQLARLESLLKPSRINDIDPEPRLPWLPLGVISRWLQHWTGKPIPKLEWRDALLQLVGSEYQVLPKNVTTWQTIAIGYINHDMAYFQPPYEKQTSFETGIEESAEQALDRVRIEYATRARRDFTTFVNANQEMVADIEAAYNRLFRGYVEPEYGSDEIQIARWHGRIKLKPHQIRGARRLLANNGGMLAFDVGVGKTYTGIATIAKLREDGRARRPIVVVPNTIIWKWFKDFRAALPDYNVIVIGSNRYIGRDGTYVSKIDTPEERALKWRQFQAGEFDVALVTYSVFGRTQIHGETFREWAYETPVVLRKLGLDARELAKQIDAGERTDVTRKPRVTEAALIKLVGEERYKSLTHRDKERITEEIAEQKAAERQAELDKLLAVVEGFDNLTERGRAIFGEALERWIAVRLDHYLTPDPGIFFEDLGCDCLMVDEAQNFKNLWPVAAREGGIPKYLGAISEGSDRAWALAIRAHLTRKRTGGSGVFLLSATPAKNSPLEYFTLLGYVDSSAWSRLGIHDPEVFIDRYLRIEMRQIIQPDMSIASRSVVAGFKNLDELRGIIFRFAEFRTAQEVGLTLPKTDILTISLPMNMEQEKKYAYYVDKYQKALRKAKDDHKAKNQALGYLMRMATVAIHPELDRGPGGSSSPIDEDSVGLPLGQGAGWTFSNADRVINPHCPKLDKIVEMVMPRVDCGHLVFCDNVAVHRWLKMLFVEAGYPAKRIAIFNADQAKDPAKRQQIAEKFNGTPAIIGEDGTLEQEGVEPEYDLVIANATAYEGIDLHIRTCMVFHVDLPWEPATLQQRNGRAIRQGNTQSVIGITYLFSERSLDAVRFNMISGKLGWMRDLIASSDRETNNPAAQAELSAEEMVLFLARDPEEAKAAIEEQKRLLLEEQQRRAQEHAWSTLRGLIARHNVLSRLNDSYEKAAVLKEEDALATRLGQIPPSVWPWHFVVGLVKQGTPILLAAGLALPADRTIAIGEVGGLAVGQIFNDAAGFRLFGEHAFRRIRLERVDARGSVDATDFERSLWDTLEKVDASAVENGAERWNFAEDERLFSASLSAAIDGLESGNWDGLGVTAAGESWRAYLVDKHWPGIAKALTTAVELPFLLPVISASGTLALVEAEKSADQPLITFELKRWPEFVALASTSQEKWGALNETALAWWGRPFPRGLLRNQEADSEVSVKTADGDVKARVIYRSGPLAVTIAPEQGLDHPEGPRYAVTHIPSGLSLQAGFRSPEAARSAMAFALGEKRVDWSAKQPDTRGLQKAFVSTMRWLSEQDEAVSLHDIQKFATT